MAGERVTPHLYFEYSLTAAILLEFCCSDPNSPMGVDVKWPPYSSNDRQHMVLQSSPKVAKDLAAAEVLFYTQDLPKAGKM